MGGKLNHNSENNHKNIRKVKKSLEEEIGLEKQYSQFFVSLQPYLATMEQDQIEILKEYLQDLKLP